MQEMSPHQVHQYLQTSENSPRLLDVRERWEFELCRIEGAEHIPMGAIPQQLDKLDPSQEIIVICHHGARSRMVGRFLEQAKFSNIINLSGGVAAWAQSVDPAMATY